MTNAELLREIYTQVGKIDTIKNRVDKIEEVILNPLFIRLLDNAELHLGDEESLMISLSKEYGINKRFSGHELLEKLFEKIAKDIERKNRFFDSFLNSFVNATVTRILELLAIIGLFVFFLIRG